MVASTSQIVFSVGVVYILYRLIQNLRIRSRLPPGPKGYPLIGNLFDIPPADPWVTYKQLSQQYNSDVIHINMLGTTTIVVNSFKAAQDIFDKRSAIYSDRPRFTMLNELLGFDWSMGFMKYGDIWKTRRSLFRKEFQPPATLAYLPRYLEGSRRLLQRLLAEPEKFNDALRLQAVEIILGIAYGIKVESFDDPLVDISEKTTEAMAATGNVAIGPFIVDSLPWLKHMPDWFPGAGFKTLAAEWRKSVSAMPVVTMDFVKKSMADGTAISSIASRNLQEMHDDGTYSPEKEAILRDVLGSMYSAGADTTVAAFGTLILVMLLYPEVQRKGQAAVDAYFKGDRLPDFTDMKQIPYVDAMVKELLRWKPVTPLAVPHSNVVDDEYNGYYIPKGSVVVGNSWALLYDEKTFGPDVEHFNPDRFMKGDDLDPDVPHPTVAFGFGRRVCPGQYTAENIIWITIASILTCFDVSCAVDENGKEIKPTGEFDSGLLCYPKPFDCQIKPRSEKIASLIREGL